MQQKIRKKTGNTWLHKIGFMWHLWKPRTCLKGTIKFYGLIFIWTENSLIFFPPANVRNEKLLNTESRFLSEQCYCQKRIQDLKDCVPRKKGGVLGAPSDPSMTVVITIHTASSDHVMLHRKVSIHSEMMKVLGMESGWTDSHVDPDSSDGSGWLICTCFLNWIQIL